MRNFFRQRRDARNRDHGQMMIGEVQAVNGRSAPQALHALQKKAGL
jgi:hypothetical protein